MGQNIHLLICSLKSNKNPRFDDISSTIVKHCRENILNTIKYVFSLSCKQGAFSESLKTAPDLPIFKKDEKNLFTNYRSVSVLPCFSSCLQAFNEIEYTIGIFIDLSKECDTVDHPIILQKLELYGNKNNNLKWFQNYMSNNKQSIKFNKK